MEIEPPSARSSPASVRLETRRPDRLHHALGGAICQMSRSTSWTLLILLAPYQGGTNPCIASVFGSIATVGYGSSRRSARRP
jgi:hypothetical protein